MIVNPDDVDVYSSLKKQKHPEKRKKQQPTEKQKNTEYQNVSKRVPSFYI